MHHLIEFARGVAGFGERSLSIEDFNRETEQHGIRTLELPFGELYGATRTVRGKVYIGLRADLSQSDKLLTAWHEFLHGAWHHPTTNYLLRTINRTEKEPGWEAEAEAFALAAVIPQVDLFSCRAAELCRRYKISPAVLVRRWTAWLDYGL